MKTHTENNIVERSNGLQEHAFSIKATARSFEILSSGLYSNKILAICRELSCNAYDAHVAAGNSSTPIEIKLPNSLSPTFYVKDFGIGLSHDDMLKLYTTYFESTKNDSNDFIGALGLGSKSPYCYTSNFTVESRYQGMKRIYTCFLNESRLPSITLLDEEVSDEPNGLTIMMSVKSDDMYKFQDAAKKALMYFDPMPNVLGYTGFAPYNIKHTLTGSNWKIRENDYYAYMNGPQLVQGFVAYPIDSDAMSDAGMSEVANTLSKISIDFDVNIGDVEVAASREALQYDIRTVNNLAAVFELAAVEMRDSFQKSFDDCANYWEVGVLIEEFQYNPSYEFRKIFANLNKADPFTWNGTPVSTTMQLDLSNIKNTTLTGYAKRSTAAGTLRSFRQWTPPHYPERKYEQNIKKDIYVLIDNKASGNSEAYKSYLNSLSRGVDNKEPTLLVIRPTTNKLYDQNEIDYIIDQLGNSRCIKIEDTGFVTEKIVNKTKYVKRVKSDKLLWTGFPRDSRGLTDRSFTRKCWSTTTVDMEAGGFYIPVNRYKPEIYHLRLDILLDYAISLGFIPKGTTVCGFSIIEQAEVTVSNRSTNKQWINIFDHLTYEFERANVDDRLLRISSLQNVCYNVGNNFSNHLMTHWSAISSKLPEGIFKQFFDKMVEIKEIERYYPSSSVSGFMDIMSMTNLAEAFKNTLLQEWQDITDRYEMLNVCHLYSATSDQIDVIVRYINTIESSLTSV